ncbi:hypothetical protein HanRHA438_Chr13g0600771 [Helianthus annuus]|nr:hypothetical protein HanRHA438_Chr13g0600771 [Helianthus annuus]
MLGSFDFGYTLELKRLRCSNTVQHVCLFLVPGFSLIWIFFMKWVLGVMLEMLCVFLLVGFDVACFLQVIDFASGADGARWCHVVLAGAGGAPLCRPKSCRIRE